MSDITIVTNPNKLTTVPRCASDSIYTPGVDPWSSQPNKVAPPSGMLSQGRVPLMPASAEVENYYTAHFADAIIELQLQQPPVAAGFTNLSDVRFAWLPKRKVLLQHQVFSGPAEKRVQYSPNLSKNVVSAMTNTFGSSGFEWRHVAAISTFTGSDLLYYMSNAAQGGDSMVVVSSSGSMSDSTVALPGSSTTQYRDLLLAHDSGAVLALGCAGSAFKLSRFPLVGSPTSVAVGSPWTSDGFAVLANKPGETRAWQCDKGIGSAHNTFATTDGGVTIGSVVQTTWNGGSLDTASSIMRPCWDSVNNRWIVSTADLTDYTSMAGNATLWTSTNGVAWTLLHTTPTVLFCSITEHRGLLWALGLQLGSNSHKGMEVYCSKDGGDTWIRTGHVLTLAQYDSVNQTLATFNRDTRIESAGGAYLLFQTGLSIVGTESGGTEGIDFLILRTSDMYDS